MASIQTRLEDFSREKAMPRDDREAISRIRARHVARMSEAYARGLLAALQKMEARSRC
ncbi:MAG: hypothetical protein QXU26_03930 [Thermofilaceae archaeon]